jgi:hypothetical protein
MNWDGMTEGEREQAVTGRVDMRPTNCLADWSLALGIVVLFFALLLTPYDLLFFASLCLAGVPGVALGARAVLRARRDPLRQGQVKAVVGVVLPLLAVALACSSMLAFNSRIREYEQRQAHQSDLKALAIAAEAYCADSSGRFPPANRWASALRPYLASSSTRHILRGKPSFAMNHSLSGVSRRGIKQPDETILFFDSAQGRNVSGGPELICYSHNRASLVRVDGSVRSVTPRQARKLKWNP